MWVLQLNSGFLQEQQALSTRELSRMLLPMMSTEGNGYQNHNVNDGTMLSPRRAGAAKLWLQGCSTTKAHFDHQGTQVPGSGCNVLDFLNLPSGMVFLE